MAGSETGAGRLASPFTELSAEETLRLWPLAVHARHILERLRIVSYDQAEEDAALLAAKLNEQVPPSLLQDAAFVGIPRGGLIVLGMLAYQLDLRRDQLLPTVPQNGPICIVDDCALSGFRLRQMIDAAAGDPLIVANLYAPSGLRDAVLARYPQVAAFVSAHDLREIPAANGALPNRQELEQLSGTSLFPGADEIVTFAWSEPDIQIMTPFDERPSSSWRFLPPHKCLANRQALDLPPRYIASREWIVPGGIVYGWFEGTLYLLDTRREQVHRLDGLAADSWRVLAGYGRVSAALAYLAQRHPGQSTNDLQQDLRVYLAAFRANDLLSPV